jgi:hypothetical protein
MIHVKSFDEKPTEYFMVIKAYELKGCFTCQWCDAELPRPNCMVRVVVVDKDKQVLDMPIESPQYWHCDNCGLQVAPKDNGFRHGGY